MSVRSACAAVALPELAEVLVLTYFLEASLL